MNDENIPAETPLYDAVRDVFDAADRAMNNITNTVECILAVPPESNALAGICIEYTMLKSHGRILMAVLQSIMDNAYNIDTIENGRITGDRNV